MISKVAIAQPVFYNYKRAPQQSKDGLKKRKVSSFAGVLEDTIKSKSKN